MVIVVINNNLKFCREEIGITQKELGFVFSVHESTVSGWETGKDTIPLRKLIKFCNLYGFSLDYAIGLSRTNNFSSKIDDINIKRIGNNLRNMRVNLNMTQQEIADECSISQTTYSNYELGFYLISTMTLYVICKNHNLSMDSIFR